MGDSRVAQNANCAADTGGVLDAEPIYQSESFPESPAIHVAVLPDVDSAAFRWIRVGAEEEGIPCREVPVPFRQEAPAQADPVAAAYAAAQESRLGMGVAVGRGRVTLHEAHMPAERPVWELPLGADLRPACRLVGCNAGRMVKRMPLRFEQENTPAVDAETQLGARGGVSGGVLSEIAAPDPVGPEVQADAAYLAAVVVGIVRALQGRGVV